MIERGISGYFQRFVVKIVVVRPQVRGRGRSKIGGRSETASTATAAFDPSLRGDGAWVFDDVVPVEVVLRDREDTLVKDARRVRVIATSDARVVVELLSEADLFSHLEADVDEAAFEGLRRAQGLDGDWAGFAGLVRDLAAKARDGAGAVLRLSLDCEGGGTLRAVAAHDARRVDLVALAVATPHWRTTRALAEHRYFASAAARLSFERSFEGHRP